MKKILLVLMVLITGYTGLIAQESTSTVNILKFNEVPWDATRAEIIAFEKGRGFFKQCGDDEVQLSYCKSQHYETLDLSSLPEPYKLMISTEVIYVFHKDKLVRTMILISYDNIAIMDYPMNQDFEKLLELYPGTDDAAHNPELFTISRNDKQIWCGSFYSNDGNTMNIGLLLINPDYKFDEVIQLLAQN
jgi:hypothetical protein